MISSIGIPSHVVCIFTEPDVLVRVKIFFVSVFWKERDQHSKHGLKMPLKQSRANNLEHIPRLYCVTVALCRASRGANCVNRANQNRRSFRATCFARRIARFCAVLRRCALYPTSSPFFPTPLASLHDTCGPRGWNIIFPFTSNRRQHYRHLFADAPVNCCFWGGILLEKGNV